MQIGKEEIKLFLFPNDSFVRVEDPKESKNKKQILELISKFSKMADTRPKPPNCLYFLMFIFFLERARARASEQVGEGHRETETQI